MGEKSHKDYGHKAPPDMTVSQEEKLEWRSRVEDLFCEHNNNLIRFIAPRIKSEQAARDIAQEAYVRLLQLDKPGSTNFLRAYLFKIASNLVIDYTRKKIRHHAYANNNPLLELTSAAYQERSVSAGQQIEIVRKAVDELPEKCRRAFLLGRVHDWSSSRISLHLNVTKRMVRLYMVRALEHIQLRLDEEAALQDKENS